MSGELRIAMAQVTVSKDPRANLETAEHYLRNAARRGAELIVFPEMFMACPQKGEPLAGVAEPLEGPFVSALCDLAKRYGMAIVSGVWEKVPQETERAANVVIVIDAAGNMVERYNKIHLFNAMSVRETDQMTGGHCPPPLFEINGLNVGLAICYDLRFPELFRHLSEQGADAVIVPSAWYAGAMKEEHWLCLLQARAIENTMYVAGANLCSGAFAGRSALFDPFGVLISGAGEGETLITGAISATRIAEVREKLPCLNHVRKDLF